MWLRVFSMKAAFYDVYDDVVGLKGCTVPFHAKNYLYPIASSRSIQMTAL